jgi:hypothetical protein
MVQKLPAEKMTDLVEIIKEGLPDDKKNDDISEVPLDLLDTLTLRKLQKFLRENVLPTKKRPVGATTTPRVRPSDSQGKKAKKAKTVNGAVETSFSPNEDIDLFNHYELEGDFDVNVDGGYMDTSFPSEDNINGDFNESR